MPQTEKEFEDAVRRREYGYSYPTQPEDYDEEE